MIASSFFTYLWHYVVARLLYAQLIREPGRLLLLALIAGAFVVFLVRRRSRR